MRDGERTHSTTVAERQAGQNSSRFKMCLLLESANSLPEIIHK